METTRRTELEELRHQACQITDESLESTRRMLNMVEQSADAGKETMETLDIQKEQLNRIEQGMDNINADMSVAEKSLSRLKQCCNICSHPFKKVTTHSEPDEKSKSEIETNFQIIVDQPQRTNVAEKQSHSIPINSSVGYITRITNDAREDEMESNLYQVNSILSNLKNIAVDMNSELSQQNAQIERINTKGDANTIRLDQVNVTATSLLNK